MEWYWSFLLLNGGIVFLMMLGVPIAFAFLLVNVAAAYHFMGGEAGLLQLVANGTTTISAYALAPVPLFILMGEILFHSKQAVLTFDALDKFFARVPGRLCFLTIGGGTIFAALMGSAMATTAMLGSLLVPEMVRRGYKKSMIMGPIMGCGALAIVIPPSGLAVLLGSIGRIDIAALLIAGIVPGLLLALFYFGLVYFQVKRDPSCAPAYVDEKPTAGEKLRALVAILPITFAMIAVVAVMIVGWATPTESAAFGVLAAVILAKLQGEFSWAVVVRSLRGTVNVTAMVLLIIFASSTFAQILAFSGASRGAIGWATGFAAPGLVMLAMMFAILLVLGFFMDELSMMMLTLPIFMPIAAHYGFDPVWFGTIVLMSLNIGLLSPPFGLVLFVMLGVAPAGTTFQEVVNASLPYMFLALVVVVLLIAFPPLATWLPDLMK
jgi:tripartite ATP-independent transporter DctM subunit